LLVSFDWLRGFCRVRGAKVPALNLRSRLKPDAIRALALVKGEGSREAAGEGGFPHEHGIHCACLQDR
jgi:hypothetical protein